MMRVAWMTPWYPWAGDTISGSFHQTQARAVAALGVHVRVVAARPMVPGPLARLRRRWSAYAAMPRHEQDGAIEIERPPYLAIPGEPGWARAPAAVALAAGRVLAEEDPPDLVHGHFVVPTGMAARRVARRLGRPYLVTVHGYDATSWPAAHRGQLDEYRATLHEARAVVAVSRSLAARVLELTGVEALTLPLGVDHAGLRRLAMAQDVARRALGLPEGRPIVLFAATNVVHKGLREYVDAILTLGPPVLGVVIGAGPLAGYRAEEGRRAGVLRYAGPQDRAGVVRHMSAANLLVLPSYQEGLPTVVVEAGSLGLPVVATAVDGTPELLGDDRGLLIPPRDTGAIVEAIRAVVDDPAAAAARAARLRTLVERAFDVRANAEALVALYRTVAGLGATGPRTPAERLAR
jgi:teichuronic acid biosynthesis glycosyltransferase TuaC